VDWLSACQQEQGKLDLFEKLVVCQKHQILLINDNPYSFVLDNPMSLLQVNGAKEVALELNSLSKTFNRMESGNGVRKCEGD
jgi:aspartate/methionine/tyrosine aminotransferase